MLGDAGTDNSDASYTGEVSDSSFSLDYYRQKAREFQGVLNQVDATAQAARQAIAADISPELSADLGAMLSEFDAKKLSFRLAAEGINAGASVINSMGGRFPSLSIPAGLGFAPFVIPAAAIAAIGAAAALIAWGVQWIGGVNQRLLYEQLTSKGTPTQQAELARALALSEASANASSESPLASVAGVVKWGAIALVAWMAFQAYEKRGRA